MLRLLARQIISVSRGNRFKKISFRFEDFKFPAEPLKDTDLAELLAVEFEMSNFEFVKYRTPPEEGWNFVKEVIVTGALSAGVKDAFKKGQAIGEAVNACRALANTPGGEMTPTLLAKAATLAARGSAVTVRVLGKKDMEKLGMGGVLGVSQGSSEEPRFIILEYRGLPAGRQGAKDNPVVLVGKGITFDAGGLNVKSGNSMYEMHMDMSGGAAVIHAVILASKLKLKCHVVGLIPAAENMPSGGSYRPGDILKSMSGKTIEVLNTDAEGRVVLADALTYAKKYAPRLVVDVATLTGSAMSALGQRASALFTKDKKLSELFERLGEESGDYVWPLPLWDEYEEDIKGTFGDVANTGKTRYGDAISGAMFLYQFVKDSKESSGQAYPWVHIDIAPRMTSIDGEYLAKGAAGAPVRLLIRLLREF